MCVVRVFGDAFVNINKVPKIPKMPMYLAPNSELLNRG